MIGQGVRAAFLVLGTAVVAVTALTMLPSDEAFEEKLPPVKTSPPSRLIVEQAPDSLYADRGGSDAQGPADVGWRQVASGFVRDLASHDGDHASWHRRVSRWTTPSLAEALNYADGRLVPTGPLQSINIASQGLGVVEATATFRGGVKVALMLFQRGTGEWVVASLIDAESPT